MTTEFARRLKAARKHSGLTQKQLAPLAGMSQSNLSELETVAHESGKTAQLAAVCGVSAHWLATGEGAMLGPTALPPPSSTRQATPSLQAALPVVLDALVTAPDRGRVRTALLALLDDDAPAYRQRLAELLAELDLSGKQDRAAGRARPQRETGPGGMTAAPAYPTHRLTGRASGAAPPGRVVCIERDRCRRRVPCGKGLCA